MSNYANNHDANYQISHYTEHIDNGNKNAFLLYIGTNTNMSSYLHDLYENDETENTNEYENEMRIYEALDLQMPKNMKYENMKMMPKNMKYENTKYENEMNTEYISEYLDVHPSKINEWILYKTATEKNEIYIQNMNIASQSLNDYEYDDEIYMKIIKRAKMRYMCTMII